MSNLISRSLPHIRCMWMCMDTPFLVFQILILYAKKYEFRNTKKNFHPLRICDSHLSYSLLNLNQQNDDEEKWKKNKKFDAFPLRLFCISALFFPPFWRRIYAKNSSQSTHRQQQMILSIASVRTTFNSLCVKCEQKNCVQYFLCSTLDAFFAINDFSASAAVTVFFS